MDSHRQLLVFHVALQAFGPTPAYSVSKAALNVLTRIQAREVGREREKPGSNPCYQIEKSQLKLRAVAVCPGDVETRMCSAGEGDRDLTPAQAAGEIARFPSGSQSHAGDVICAIERPSECPSGGFYREREAIPW